LNDGAVQLWTLLQGPDVATCLADAGA